MKIRLQHSRRIPNGLDAFCLLVSAGGVIYVLGTYQGLADSGDPSPRAFVGPFAGGTRAVACLLEGRWLDALNYSPLSLVFVALLGLVALHFLTLVLISGRRVGFGLSQRESWAAFGVALLVLISGWIYAAYSGAYLIPFEGASP